MFQAFSCLGQTTARDTTVAHFEGIITLVDAHRRLVVLQDQTNVLAVSMEPTRFALRAGDRTKIDGETAPVNLPTITVFPDYPDRPSGREWRSDFTAPTNWGENFICRMRGFVRPPKSGDYRFWVSSDDESELWLSPDAEPARARKIAVVPTPGWTLPGEWNKYPGQRSLTVFLESDKSYYIEAVQVQHRREDNLAVAWEGPDIPRCIIGHDYLRPWLTGVDVSRVKGWTAEMTNGIIREYWTNASVWRGLELTGRTRDKTIVKMDDPHVTNLGGGPLPQPLRIAVGQPLSVENNFRWAEVEGEVDFAASDGNSLTLELTDAGEHMRVRVLDWAGTSLPHLMNSRVRLRGVCETVQDDKGRDVAGLLWVPRANEIPLVKPTETERFAMRSTRLADLIAPDPDARYGQKVRVGGTVVEVLPDKSFVIQDQGSFYGYVSTDGTNWTQFGNAVEIPMSNSVCAGLAVCSCTNGILTTARFGKVRGISATAENSEVGSILKAGTSKADGSGILLSGSGDDITGRWDSFQFLHEPLTGDGEIVARVDSLEPVASRGWPRAGLMIRESLSPSSKFIMLSQTASAGVFLQYRINNNVLAEGLNNAGYQMPTWVKLVRQYNHIRVAAAETFAAQAGQPLDIVGFFDFEQGNAIIKQAFCEERAGAATAEGLRNESQLVSNFTEVSIRRLLVGPFLTSEGFRLEGVRIQGTVTFNGNVLGKRYFFIQDETGAIAVKVDRLAVAALPQVGQKVCVYGTKMAGKFSDAIDCVQIRPLGWGDLPRPMTRSVALSNESHGDGTWIEVSGVVHGVRADGLLEIATPDGKSCVWVDGASAAWRETCVDATVRLRGVMSPAAEPEPLLLVPSPDYVEMADPAPVDPFAGPMSHIASLAGFNPRIEMAHRVRVAGTVTWRQERTFFLQNTDGCVRVQALSGSVLKVGGSVEVAGFPEQATHLVLLTHALVRNGGPMAPARPAATNAEDLFSGRENGQLVKLESGLLRQRTDRQRQVLELQVGRRIVEATLPLGCGIIPRIREGSTLSVTGVCRWEPGLTVASAPSVSGSQYSGSVEILLRVPTDVVLLHNPPWWTVRRVLGLIGTLIGVVLVSAVWIHTLRRQIEARSRELEAATSKLAEESRNAAVLAERQRLAGEIHDSLQQGFTGIRLQLDAANSKLGEDPDIVRRYLNTAQSMVQYSLAEVKSALWNWHSHMLKESDLATSLSTIARQIGAASPMRVDFLLAGDPRPLSPTVEHHLLRISQEGITNAIKHANAKSIWVVLEYTRDAVRLTIRDDGRGFDLKTALDVRGTHFGLSGLLGRARKLGTQMTISSEPGKGTSLVVMVPTGDSSQAATQDEFRTEKS